MIVLKLQGGLGNQMFQYAAGKSLALHHGVDLILETSFFSRSKNMSLEIPRNFELHVFTGVTEKQISEDDISIHEKYPFLKERKIEKFLPKYKRRVYKEPFYGFDTNFFKSKSPLYLKGQWQSEKYFSKYKKEIAAIFEIKESFIQNVKSFADTIRSSKSVSIHIRRSDYLKDQHTLEWHGVMEKDYYQRAFEQLTKKTPINKVYYFSDDVEWVKTELLPIIPGELVSGVITNNHFEDLYLMSRCDHNIIANSSFSWWAAWLNHNPGKIIIAPKKWFNKGPKAPDLIPKEWLKI